jgi:hypothetical protein
MKGVKFNAEGGREGSSSCASCGCCGDGGNNLNSRRSHGNEEHDLDYQFAASGCIGNHSRCRMCSLVD